MKKVSRKDAQLALAERHSALLRQALAQNKQFKYELLHLGISGHLWQSNPIHDVFGSGDVVLTFQLNYSRVIVEMVCEVSEDF